MIKCKILTSLFIVVILETFVIWKIPEAKAAEYTLADLEQQITDALDWLDRMVYIEINSTHAVATDTPQLSFRVRLPSGNYSISGKETERLTTNLPPQPDRNKITGGGFCEGTGMLNRISNPPGMNASLFCNNAMVYRFDLDGDQNVDDLTLYVEYATINATWTMLYGEVTATAVSGNYDLILDQSDLVIDNIAVGKKFTRYKQYGWPGCRYTIRPTVKGLADLYYNLATISCPWLGGQTYQQYRGVNYTDRAMKLYRTWYESGYIIDRFDGHYGVTTNERPFPEIHGGIPANPDLIMERWWLHLYDTTSYYINSPTEDWYNYTNIPTMNGRESPYVLRHSVVSRHVMPENEEWVNVPFKCSDTQFIFPYKSRTGFEGARNAYIANGFTFDLTTFQKIPWIEIFPGPEGDVCLGIGTDAKSIRACHDMYKYGKDVPYGLSKLKGFIDHGLSTWDGKGVAFDRVDTAFGYGLLGWPYPAYGTHNTATFGNALIQYYKITGDKYYIEQADEVVGVLTMLQNKLGKPIYSRSLSQEYYMAEYVGSFLPGYAVAYSFGQQNIYTAGWVDLIYTVLKYLNVFEEDPQPLTYPCLGNAEVTIPAVWTLIEYRTLNRIPKVPAIPDYVLSTENVIVYTDHGGSWGGDGNVEICSDKLTSSHIGGETGNLWKHEGKVDRFRMWAASTSIGEAWSTIEYVWQFTLSQSVTNWRTKLYFTVPDAHGVVFTGGNSLGVWVELYNSAGKLIISEARTSIENLVGTAGYIKFYDNLTMLDSLSAGIYTIKLRFKCHAGGGRSFHLGYYKTIANPGLRRLPMGLEYFGYDCDPTNISEPVKYSLKIESIGPGTTSPLGVQTYTEGTVVNVTALPSEGKYFKYWIVNNTRLGIWHNYTKNPINLYMDHDYNLTAYFSDTTEPPPTEYMLKIVAISIPTGSLGGTTTPSPGVYNYTPGSNVQLTANMYEGFHFRYWLVTNSTDAKFLYSQSINLQISSDLTAIAYFALTKVKFAVVDSTTGNYLTSEIHDVNIYNVDHPENGWSIKQPIREGNYWSIYLASGTYNFRFYNIDGYCDKIEYNVVVNAVDEQSKTVYLFPVYFFPKTFSGGGGGFRYLRSEKMIFYAIISYSGEYTENYWIDINTLIYVQPSFNMTAQIKIVMHYATNYFPVIEIEAQNVAYVNFNITKLYQKYAEENYKEKLDTNHWTGFSVKTNKHLILEVSGFPYKPMEIWRVDEKGKTTEVKDWTWVSEKSAILMDKFSTVSLIFGTEPNSILPWINVLAIVILVSFAFALMRRYVEI